MNKWNIRACQPIYWYESSIYIAILLFGLARKLLWILFDGIYFIHEYEFYIDLVNDTRLVNSKHCFAFWSDLECSSNVRLEKESMDIS